MNLSFKNVLCVCCLLLSGSVYAQVPQDLIDKAKAAGMSDTQIQQELAKRMKQEGGSVGSQATATDATVSDRVMPVIDEGQSLEAQRRNNLPELVHGYAGGYDARNGVPDHELRCPDHRRRICARLHEGNGCGKCHGYPGRILSL